MLLGLAIAAVVLYPKGKAGKAPADKMNLSQRGAALLIEREGVRNKAYLDSVGVPTIGVGHTGNDFKLGDVWSDEKVKEVFAADVQRFVRPLNDALRGVRLTQDQFDALVSFAFNIGVGGFKSSDTYRHLRAGNVDKAGHAMRGWLRPREIEPRRNGEVAQFYSKSYAARVTDLNKFFNVA